MSLYIEGIVFDELTSDLGTPLEGELWYNTTDKRYKVYTNSTTEELIYNTEFTTHTGSLLNPHQVTAAQVGLGSVTNDAQLLRSANDFNTFAQKTTVSGADIILIEDSEAAGVKKYVTVSDLVQDVAPGLHAGTHIDGGSDVIDGDKVEISWTGHTNYTPVTSPAEVDATDQLTAHLAGIDAQLAAATGLLTKAGRVAAGSFAGNPKTATVTFSAAFASTNYGVVATALTDDARKSYNIHIITKTTGGFTISLGTNKTSNLTEVAWVATADGETV